MAQAGLDPLAARLWFESVDADRSGLLDAKELRQALDIGGLNYSLLQAHLFVRAFDSQGKHKLNLPEFIEVSHLHKHGCDAACAAHWSAQLPVWPAANHSSLALQGATAGTRSRAPGCKSRLAAGMPALGSCPHQLVQAHCSSTHGVRTCQGEAVIQTHHTLLAPVADLPTSNCQRFRCPWSWIDTCCVILAQHPIHCLPLLRPHFPAPAPGAAAPHLKPAPVPLPTAPAPQLPQLHPRLLRPRGTLRSDHRRAGGTAGPGAKGFSVDATASQAMLMRHDPDMRGQFGRDEWLKMCLFMRTAQRAFAAFDTGRAGRVEMAFNQFVYAAAHVA